MMMMMIMIMIMIIIIMIIIIIIIIIIIRMITMMMIGTTTIMIMIVIITTTLAMTIMKMIMIKQLRLHASHCIRIGVFKTKLPGIIDIIGTMSCSFYIKCFTRAALCILNGADANLRILSTDASGCFFINVTFTAVAEISIRGDFFQKLS